MQHERLMLSAADLAAERELRPEGAPPPRLSIVHLPEQLTPEHDVERSLVVLIDVQRMTTTLTTAMAEGAAAFRVFREVEEVHAAAEFDHQLFCQAPNKPLATATEAAWESSYEPAPPNAKEYSAGVLEPGVHAYRVKVVGERRNGDAYLHV